MNQTLNSAGYKHCTCCGAILGFTAMEGITRYLYTFAYPPRSIRQNLASRRVTGRWVSGELFCPHCNTWQSFDYLSSCGVGD